MTEPTVTVVDPRDASLEWHYPSWLDREDDDATARWRMCVAFQAMALDEPPGSHQNTAAAMVLFRSDIPLGDPADITDEDIAAAGKLPKALLAQPGGTA